jgi:beta-glucanase (GH16 family)
MNIITYIKFWHITHYRPELLQSDCDIDKPGYTLIFNDEFNSGLLDKTKWRPKMYWSGNLYPKERRFWFDENRIYFTDNSILLDFKISPKEFTENGETFIINNAIGLICTENSFNLNDGDYYLEARIKVPPINGTWCAFWTYGMESNVNGDPSEIDILEQLDYNMYSFSTNFHVTNLFKRHQNLKSFKMPFNLSDDFHRYGVSKEENKLTFYFDGVACKEIKKDVKFLTDRQHIILNNAPGSTTIENTMEVDWIRLYKSTIDIIKNNINKLII